MPSVTLIRLIEGFEPDTVAELVFMASKKVGAILGEVLDVVVTSGTYDTMYGGL